MQAHSVQACKLAYSGWSMCLERLGLYSWFHRYFDLSDLTKFGWDMGLCTQAHRVHARYFACSGQIMCSGGLACYLNSIDTSISLIWPNLVEIWACACKHIGCMHAILRAWGHLFAQKGMVCYLDSIDTLISLIWPNLVEIWAHAHKHIACMHASLRAQVILCAQRGLAWSPDSIDTLISLIGPNWAELTI